MGEGEVLHTELDGPFLDAAIAERGQLLAIDSLDEHNPILLRLREMLEYTLEARCWLNVYVTATDASNFGPHTDTQDTIIVQVLGRKQWTVCPKPKEGDNVGWDRASTSILDVGDVLYVPAATGHDVVGIGDLSVHLTIGFDPDCWLPAQARELGTFLGRRLAPPTSAEIAHALAVLPERRRGGCLPFRHSRSLDDAAYVRWASRLPPRVLDSGDSGVEVISMGRTHRFPGRCRACVIELALGRELRREELLELAGGDHSVLCEFLISASAAGLILIRPADDEVDLQQA